MRLVFACVLLLLMPLSAQSADRQPEGDPLAMGAYVPTDDIARAEAFYRRVLDRAPVIALEDFVAFDVAGGWFAIVSRARYAPGAVAGSGAVPYLQSRDLEAVRARVAEATGAPAPEIIVEPGIELLKVLDPDGQLVEFFRLTGG
ncbi:VOC family protein [Roseobacter sp. A03A-229]